MNHTRNHVSKETRRTKAQENRSKALTYARLVSELHEDTSPGGGGGGGRAASNPADRVVQFDSASPAIARAGTYAALTPGAGRAAADATNPAGGLDMKACLFGYVAPRVSCEPLDEGGCLSTPVPAWTIPHARVQECFRCCLHSALARAGVLQNVPRMLDFLYNRSFNPWWKGTFDPEYRHHAGASWGAATHASTYAPLSVLLGDVAFLRFAHAAVAYYESHWTVSSRAPRGARTLAVVQGYTQLHPAALATLRRWLRRGVLRGNTTLLISGDPYLPTAPEPLLDRANVRVGVHNPSARRPNLFVYPRGVLETGVWDALLSRPEIARAQISRDRRPNLLHCSCLNALRHELRRDKLSLLRKNGFRCEERCEHGAGHARALQSKFGFSPRGNSAQNYRDWETLLAGAIPLVDADPALDGLYDGLPVVAVTNWSVVTPAYLNAVWQEMRAREYSWEKLYLPFWLGKVLGE